MEASAIASVKKHYCHESFCESVRHVVDILFKFHICIPTLTLTL